MAAKKTINLKPFHSLCRQDMANILGIAPSAIRGYVERGAPQNEDGTYDLSAFVNHIITKRQRGRESDDPDIDRQIKEETLRKKRLDNEEMEGSLISREVYDAHVGQRAMALSSFLSRALPENAQQMEMKKAEELRPILLEIAIQAVDIYRGKKKGDD